MKERGHENFGKYKATDGTVYIHLCDRCKKDFRTCCPDLNRTRSVTKCLEYEKEKLKVLE